MRLLLGLAFMCSVLLAETLIFDGQGNFMGEIEASEALKEDAEDLEIQKDQPIIQKEAENLREKQDENPRENQKSSNVAEPASSLLLALQNGDKRADIGTIIKFSSNSYFALCMGLFYESVFYNNLRLHMGFRAAYPLHFKEQLPKHESLKDFKEFAALSRTFLEYFDGDTAVLLGRIETSNRFIFYKHLEPSTHSLPIFDSSFDGLLVENNSFSNLLLNFAWIYDYGYVEPFSISKFAKAEVAGAYHVGATYSLFEFLNFESFIRYLHPTASFNLGANLDYEFVYASLNFSGSFSKAFSMFLQTYAGFRVSIVDARVGYVQSAPKVGTGNLLAFGGNPALFFTNTALRRDLNSHLGFLDVEVKSRLVTLGAIYSFNYYVDKGSKKADKSHEFSVYSSIEISKASYFKFYYVYEYINKKHHNMSALMLQAIF